MKKLILLAVVCFGALNLAAQNDVMYFMKDGRVVNKQSIKSESLDSIIFYQPHTISTFVDERDDNVYQTVTIGDKVWMAENLRYIPAVMDPKNTSTSMPRYYVYGYEGTVVKDAKNTYNYNTYGVLYNLEAAKIACPEGWHIPSRSEWEALITYLGGSSVAGAKMKTTGTAHWQAPNYDATNESGFNALPGGKIETGASRDLTSQCNFWTSSYLDSINLYYCNIYSSSSSCNLYLTYRDRGLSLRCVKD